LHVIDAATRTISLRDWKIFSILNWGYVSSISGRRPSIKAPSSTMKVFSSEHSGLCMVKLHVDGVVFGSGYCCSPGYNLGHNSIGRDIAEGFQLGAFWLLLGEAICGWRNVWIR